jgi:DeoR/GlpR family transcriptional regulator of sugar metabolism
MSKFHSKITIVDGIKFHSAKEARHYINLKMMVKGGLVTVFERQVKFPISIDNIHICNYYADFVVYFTTGIREVQDVKGFKTDIYKLKKKLVEASYKIKIVEI